MLRFTIVIEPEDFHKLPENMRERIIDRLPQKIEYERQRIEYAQMRLQAEAEANRHWQDIFNASF